jgi:hypothetical protein
VHEQRWGREAPTRPRRELTVLLNAALAKAEARRKARGDARSESQQLRDERVLLVGAVGVGVATAKKNL